jgi:phosphotransferase system HPr (HPr) family protein
VLKYLNLYNKALFITRHLKERTMINRIVNVNDQLEFSDTLINEILQTGKNLNSRITLKRNNHVADCRSILEVLLLGTEKCSQLEISADGEDEQIAVQKICNIFNHQGKTE